MNLANLTFLKNHPIRLKDVFWMPSKHGYNVSVLILAATHGYDVSMSLVQLGLNKPNFRL
jgi:hypothetical protein